VPEFKVTTFHPRNENAKIYPKAEWQVRFSNNLDANSLDVSKIKVTPHLPGTLSPPPSSCVKALLADTCCVCVCVSRVVCRDVYRLENLGVLQDAPLQ
jgi:hypothetical protein